MRRIYYYIYYYIFPEQLLIDWDKIAIYFLHRNASLRGRVVEVYAFEWEHDFKHLIHPFARRYILQDEDK